MDVVVEYRVERLLDGLFYWFSPLGDKRLLTRQTKCGAWHLIDNGLKAQCDAITGHWTVPGTPCHKMRISGPVRSRFGMA